MYEYEYRQVASYDEILDGAESILLEEGFDAEVSPRVLPSPNPRRKFVWGDNFMEVRVWEEGSVTHNVKFTIDKDEDGRGETFVFRVGRVDEPWATFGVDSFRDGGARAPWDLADTIKEMIRDYFDGNYWGEE